MDFKAYFQGKKVTLMRIGLLGRGVGDAAFLAEQGAEVLVVDSADQSVMQPSVDALKKYSNITFKFGPYDPEDFVHADYVLKGAGTPLDEPCIAAARKAGVPIKMSASWFAELAHIPVVGVTGTRGKTTTTYMLYDIMRAAGMEVLLGGNIRGVSTLALLPQVTPNSIALMELDSWQCQGWGEAHMSPNVAVFTTFMSDHMNYYHNDMHAYLFDKAQIFINQTPSDTVVLSEQVLPQLDAYKHIVRSHVSVARAGKLDLSVLGEHNQLNAACALEAARALGIDDDVSLAALKNFKGVAGRLQFVREVGGIKFYNDTTATTPDALLVALSTVGGPHTVAIVGGTSKDVDVSVLTPVLAQQKHVVYLAGTGTDALGVVGAHSTLRAAFDEARAHAEPGDTIILSPGFSSKGIFKNEYDRGDQFDALVAGVPDLTLLKPKVRELAAALIDECQKEGISIVISRAFRSTEEQNALYALGRTQPGTIVTNAVGGMSYHNYGVAFDVRPLVPDEQKEEYYRRIGPIGKKLGLEWGGEWKDFVDLPHYEYTAGYRIDDFKNGAIDESKFT